MSSTSLIQKSLFTEKYVLSLMLGVFKKENTSLPTCEHLSIEIYI